MTINQENAKLSAEYGIPRLALNRQQRGYDQIHFRNCVKYLWWVSLINAALIAMILYVFFTQTKELSYASSFTGEVTALQAMPLQEAMAITKQNQLPPQGNNP